VSLAGDDVQSAFDQVDDKWCDSNCRAGYCPEDKCICSTDAKPSNAAAEGQAGGAGVVPSPDSAASTHPAQPTPWWRNGRTETRKETDEKPDRPKQKPTARAGRSAQPKPWWKDCGDNECGDDKMDEAKKAMGEDAQEKTDEATKRAAERQSVHPKQPTAWWKHEDEEKKQQQGMEDYMYPGSDWKDTAEIYQEGADEFVPDSPEDEPSYGKPPKSR